MGVYGHVLLSLGLKSDLTLVALANVLGSKLQDTGLLPPKNECPISYKAAFFRPEIVRHPRP